MKRANRISAGIAATAVLALWILPATSAANSHWQQWRGPEASGIVEAANPPVEWSESKNVRWKVELPGHGHSTPIIWTDLVFVQAAIKVDADSADLEGPYKFDVIAFDRKTGQKAWQKTVRQEVPHEGSHRDGSLAPSSPVTDGEHLYAFFGSRGLYCMTMDGEVVWDKDLGDMQTRNSFGEGSSPALHGDTLVVLWDHEGDSFVVALDKKSGAEKWRKPRDEKSSWTTPLVIEGEGRTQVVISGSNKIRSYDVKSGEVIWECGGLGTNCAATPAADSKVVVAMSGHRDVAGLAIRYQGAKGDLTASEAVAWKVDKNTPYVPSPLIYGDALYFLQKNNGIVSCVDPHTGKPHYDQKRLDELDTVYASPVGAADRVYIVGRNGKTYILKRGTEFEVLAVNTLDDEFSASPAVVDDAIYLRGRKYLYCIGAQ
jgi:outer membrane protein assembly factor BamB